MNQVAIVTGASRCIGAATAKLLASNGYAVCVNYRARIDQAEAVVAAVIPPFSSGLLILFRRQLLLRCDPRNIENIELRLVDVSTYIK